MVFSSPVFLFLFLPITLLITMLSGNRRNQNTLLLIASLLFYAWGEGVLVLLMLGTALFDHACGMLLERSSSKRGVLAFAICVNLCSLAWFKYANFIADSLDPLLVQWGMKGFALDPIHLPIGISFFVFHSLSYVVDVYRGQAKAQRSPGITALYIALFPQLIAGPIIRYHDVADQFTGRVMNMAGLAMGIRRFIVGLAKKVLVADLCARIADPIFALPSATLTPSVAWLGVVAYAVQIYFDFSGYSDMAIGLGRMFGFTFLENFNRPYVAASLREFWKRWHISLTNFFRDYLYIPLGGNRHGTMRTYANLLIVFLLVGLWHGANWTFVLWGMVHGSFMIIERTGWGRLLDRMPRIIGRCYAMLVVLLAWVLFRTDDPTTAWRFILAMWTPGHGDPSLVYPAYYLTNDVLIALVIGIVGGLGWWDRVVRMAQARMERSSLGGTAALLNDSLVLGVFVLSAMAIATGTYHPFIYFRF